MASSSTHLDSPPLKSVSEQLLLAQAVCQLGAGDWDAVAAMLGDSDRFPPAKRAKLTSEACSTVFGELARREGMDIAQSSLPNARPTRKIVRKLYTNNLNSVYTAIRASFDEESRLNAELAAISSGSLDDKLLDSVPDAVRSRISTAATSARASASGQAKDTDTHHTGQGDDTAHPTVTEGEPGDGSVVEPTRTRRGGSRRLKAEDVAVEESTNLDKEDAVTPVVKDEELEEASVEPSRKARSGRRSTKAAEEGDETAREDTATPAGDDDGDDGEEDEGEQDDTANGRQRTGRGRGRGGSIATKVKRGNKRKTSEPASPGPSEGRQSKRSKTEGELAADSARFRKAITLLLSQLDDDPSASMFKTAVRKTDAPSYADAIKRPMWLGQVLQRVKRGLTKDHVELMRDVALLCANAVQFNGRHDEVGQKAQELWEKLESMVEEYLSREVD